MNLNILSLFLTIEQPEEKKLLIIQDWIETAFWIMLAVAFIPLQSHIRILWKQKRWNQGQLNEPALIHWKQTQILARQLSIPYPEDLDALAQKATFSQHQIQPDELQQFEDFRLCSLEFVSSAL